MIVAVVCVLYLLLSCFGQRVGLSGCLCSLLLLCWLFVLVVFGVSVFIAGVVRCFVFVFCCLSWWRGCYGYGLGSFVCVFAFFVIAAAFCCAMVVLLCVLCFRIGNVMFGVCVFCMCCFLMLLCCCCALLLNGVLGVVCGCVLFVCLLLFVLLYMFVCLLLLSLALFFFLGGSVCVCLPVIVFVLLVCYSCCCVFSCFCCVF